MSGISIAFPKQARARIQVEVTSEINFTAAAARSEVDAFLLTQVGNLLSAGEPELFVSDRLYWRVPVQYALPHCGPLGSVGEMLVNVETGRVSCGPEQMETIKRNAEMLYSSSTPQTRKA